LKNATSVEELLTKWLTVEGPQVVTALMNAQLDEGKMNEFIEALSKAKSHDERMRVGCDKPGITSFLITAEKDVFDRYIKERVCRLNDTALMTELFANFDIVKMIQLVSV
jgi:hypothetical protein